MKADIIVGDVERIRQFLMPNFPDEMDKVASAINLILDELLEEFGDEILNVTMVDKEADFNLTKDIEELERLFAKDPQSHFTEIQLYRLWFCWISFYYRVTLGFGSIVGGLDHVNLVIRLPLEHGISRVLGKVDHPNPSVGTNQDAIQLRVFSFTLTGSAKRWVDRLTPRAVNTWGPPYKSLYQKWHDVTSSRNISNSNNTDGLAAIVRPHLDKECPLNEEVKQVEEVKYDEFGRPAPFNGSNGAKFRVGQCKVVNVDHETSNIPISSSKLNNLHGVSFLSDSDSQIAQNNDERTTKVLPCKLPPKEQNPGNFTLPCTIGDFHFYAMTDLGASINVMPRGIFEFLKLTNLRKTNMLIEMADMMKKTPLGVVENIIGQSYADWYKENSHDNKPRPRDYTFKEWMIVKVGHTNVNEPVKKALLKSWVIDCFKEALDPDKDPMERSFDDYKWVFDLEIEQLADEYELGLEKKGHILDMIWENYKNIQDLRGDQGLHSSKNSTRSPREITLNLLLYLIIHKQLLLWFRWISFDYRVTLGFGSIAGGLDHVNPVIRLPLEHGISRVLGKVDHPNPSVGTNQVIRLVLGIVRINHYDLVALPS
ncbi:mutator type transposase [Tanacetum coccineum]